MEAPVETAMEAAGFWRRFAAFVIDSVVVSIPSWLIAVLADVEYADFASLVFSLGYFTWFHGSTGQTPGDAALGIRVVDVRGDEGGAIGYSRAAMRWAVSIVSYLVLLVGYLWMLWDPDKQTWHDKAAGSLPVRV